MANDPLTSTVDAHNVPCSTCRSRPALYSCCTCAAPLCDHCARDAPMWRFACERCPIDDPRGDPWTAPRPTWEPDE